MAAAEQDDFKLSPETFADWWTPLQALAYAARCVGLKGADKALWQLLAGGMITAIAGSSSETEGSYAPVKTTEPKFIPQSQWKDLTDSSSDLWSGAYAQFYNHRGHRPLTTCVFGIKFNPNDIRPHLPPPNPVHEAEVQAAAKPTEIAEKTAETAKPTNANRGGRPRGDFWDDLWIEVCAHIHENGIPAQQVDIENLMLDWAVKNGHELSVSSVRPRARNLLKRLQKS
jgi:hypothetical protein